MIAGSLVVLGGSAVIAQAVCNAVSPQSHTLTPHSYRYSLYFSTFTHISRGRGGTGVEGRRGEGRGERGEDINTVEYSQLMMTVCGCFVQTLQSLQSFFFFFFFCLLPSAYLLVPKGTH